MIKDSIDTILIAEGVSQKIKNFAKLLHKLWEYTPLQLLEIIRTRTEAILQPMCEDTPKVPKASTAPKVEVTELSRRTKYKLIKIITATNNGQQMVLYAVVPIHDQLDGHEFKDSEIKSRVQDKLKSMYNDLVDGRNINPNLSSLFTDIDAAVQQLDTVDSPKPTSNINLSGIMPYLSEIGHEVPNVNNIDTKDFVRFLKGFKWTDEIKSLVAKSIAGGLIKKNIKDAKDNNVMRYAAGVAMALITKLYVKSKEQQHE